MNRYLSKNKSLLLFLKNKRMFRICQIEPGCHEGAEFLALPDKVLLEGTAADQGSRAARQRKPVTMVSTPRLVPVPSWPARM